MAEIYDPMDPAQLADPYPVYALARAREPVFRSSKVMHCSVWVALRCFLPLAALPVSDGLASAVPALSLPAGSAPASGSVIAAARVTR